MTDYVIMPGTDYQAICDATRTKTGDTGKLKSGEVAAKITGLKIVKEVSTESDMTAQLTTDNLGNVYKFTGESTDTYTNGDIYVVEEVE